MKIVVDTNVIASAIFFGGKPRMIFCIFVLELEKGSFTLQKWNDIPIIYKEY